ncbi:S24 family peptidase [Litorimonas sp.]|uniref:S24 family peptidase n=1 Tax=Litorimonas sp. TaxID=1892381 RepID=UPI003A85B48D
MTTPVGQKLKNFRNDCGLTVEEMAKALGKVKSSYQYYEDKYKKPFLPIGLREGLLTLARGYNLPPSRASELIGIPITDNKTQPIEGLFDGKKLPILGGARGGMEGVFADNGAVFGETMRPLSLQGVTDAYAVYVVGESMEPRYFAGEIVCLHPMRPISRGDFVVVQYEKNGERLYTIKQYIKRTEKSLHLLQLNPDEEILIPAEMVHSVHKAVATLDS